MYAVLGFLGKILSPVPEGLFVFGKPVDCERLESSCCDLIKWRCALTLCEKMYVGGSLDVGLSSSPPNVWSEAPSSILFLCLLTSRLALL